jgi:hypothetical protein
MLCGAGTPHSEEHPMMHHGIRELLQDASRDVNARALARAFLTVSEKASPGRRYGHETSRYYVKHAVQLQTVGDAAECRNRGGAGAKDDSPAVGRGEQSPTRCRRPLLLRMKLGNNRSA